MNAPHEAQLRLLDLQAADTALAQLAHRRRTLPELAALAEREQQADALAAEIIDAETRVADAADEQRRLAEDWATILRSEWAAQAADREVLEGLSRLSALLAQQAAGLAAGGRTLDPPRPAGTDAPARPAPADPAPGPAATPGRPPRLG